MSDDIQEYEKLTPGEKRDVDELMRALIKGMQSGKAVIVDVSAAGQIISVSKRTFEDLPKRLPALLKADSNKDGTIDAQEFSAAMGSMYSDRTMFGLNMSLDCKNPESGKGIVLAEDATKGLNRMITMLHRKEPGYGAEEHVEWVTKAHNIDQETREPGTAARLREELPQVYKDSDEKLLVEYQSLIGKAELGALPKQVLPLTAADLCRGLQASRK